MRAPARIVRATEAVAAVPDGATLALRTDGLLN